MKRVGWTAYALRLPLALKLSLQEAARTHQRSLNSEIVHRLHASIETYRKF